MERAVGSTQADRGHRVMRLPQVMIAKPAANDLIAILFRRFAEHQIGVEVVRHEDDRVGGQHVRRGRVGELSGYVFVLRASNLGKLLHDGEQILRPGELKFVGIVRGNDSQRRIGKEAFQEGFPLRGAGAENDLRV